ncbi:hypothetical protein BDP27DRAFT_1433472 [Rhodocollybia butyracea]|uniref:Uncharacterized protein n=1 Tax=Rhodocollybia butyracea TaxID=206335 RepID=A0A9P5TXH3_9AGAR|nr:hypothetical protein BDP27DRAFT_1433472 [Rhodocollybia butyracea]
MKHLDILPSIAPLSILTGLSTDPTTYSSATAAHPSKTQAQILGIGYAFALIFLVPMTVLHSVFHASRPSETEDTFTVGHSAVGDYYTKSQNLNKAEVEALTATSTLTATPALTSTSTTNFTSTSVTFTFTSTSSHRPNPKLSSLAKLNKPSPATQPRHSLQGFQSRKLKLTNRFSVLFLLVPTTPTPPQNQTLYNLPSRLRLARLSHRKTRTPSGT